MELVNSFSYRKYQPVIIQVNEKSKSKWDIDEDTRFKMVYVNQQLCKVLNNKDENMNTLAGKYLCLIYDYINAIRIDLSLNYSFAEKNSFITESLIFITTPFTIQEIPNNVGFEGLNKPKNIVSYTFRPAQFKQDNNYRAGSRHILLAIRDKNNKIRNWTAVKRLILHEISHTLCNHVTYRTEGNHLSDFKNAEKKITLFANSSDRVRKAEKILLEKIFK
jgi:hypothetical protein